MGIVEFDQKVVDRFKSKIIVKDNGCHEWTGYKHKGYGRVNISGKIYRTHRFSWIINNGPIDKNCVIMHTCDNPPCVNPNHLKIGRQIDNIKDRCSKKRSASKEINNKSNLNQNDINKIKELYKNEKLSQRKIASIYNISHRTVGDIVNNKTWKDS